MGRSGTMLVIVSTSIGALAGTGLLSCSSEEKGIADNGKGGISSGGSKGGGSGGIGLGGSGGTSQGPFSDFPQKPISDGSLPSDIGTQFSGSGQSSGGPCLFEPPIDALVPKNWTPLRFEWTPGTDQNVFELKLHVDNQVNDLVVYTTQSSYTIDSTVWKGLAEHSAGHDIQVTLNGAKLDAGKISAGPFLGVDGAIHLAPVAAPGSVVYWTSGQVSGGGTAFKGFTIGDTNVTTVMTPTSVGGDTTCIGCHASAPDGKFAFYTRDTATTRSVDARSVDGTAAPAPTGVVSTTALGLLGRNKQTAPVLSAAHYSTTDAVAIAVFVDATLTAGKSELSWTDLHTSDPNGGWGIIARTGDPRQPWTPTWWHDGSTIAYTSSAAGGEGVVAAVTDADPTMDIYTVPYNNHQGGPASPVPGASDPAYWEFYPVVSPNDSLLAFNRCVPIAGADSYNEPTAEVFVIPSKGGTAVRVAANDPPACVGKTSPGLTNSWPRWAPTSTESGGKKYYWLVFSSTRRAAGNPQLFISGVVTTESGGNITIEKTYPGLYVTAQVPEENNHTPAWDVFQVGPPS